jgi:hypothetical protein
MRKNKLPEVPLDCFQTIYLIVIIKLVPWYCISIA